MLIAALIIFVIGALSLGFALSQFTSNGDGEFAAFIGGGGIFVAIILVLLSMRWNVGSQNLTGYIYQRSDKWGFVTYDLRYSQGAGTDDQPSFCVASGSDEDKKLQKVVGTNDKVSIIVPSAGFRFVNNPFTCAAFASLDRVITTDAKEDQ